MALEIKRPADTRFAKALFFSPAGHGKTHLLGTAQEDERTSPMLLLDFEGGHETLAGLDIDVAEIRSWDDYSEAYEILSDPESPYKSVGVDSASETHTWALLTILDKQVARREGSGARDPDLLEQGDYGKGATQMRRLLREFRDLPMHVFFTAGAKEVEERGVGKVKVPALTGQMAEEIVHLMSIVGYLALTPSEEDSSVQERLLLLQGYPGFRTKVRSPWKFIAPDELEEPSITKLLDSLEFKQNGKPAAKKKAARK